MINSLILKLWGTVVYPTNSDRDLPEINSTFENSVLAILILLIVFPPIADTFASAPYPLVPVSSNTILSLTL